MDEKKLAAKIKSLITPKTSYAEIAEKTGLNERTIRYFVEGKPCTMATFNKLKEYVRGQ